MRSKVRIRKKVSVTTRCAHELMIAALNPSPGPVGQPTPTTSSSASASASAVLPNTNPVNALCTCCKTSFDVKTGGKCPHCKTKVLYCSKQCQVECLILDTHCRIYNILILKKSPLRIENCTVIYSYPIVQILLI